MTTLPPELEEVAAWSAANDARRDEIVQAIVARLPVLEYVGVDTYNSEEINDPTAPEPFPSVTFRHRVSGVLFQLMPGGTFQMGMSDRQFNALRKIDPELLVADGLFMVNLFVNEPEEGKAHCYGPIRSIRVSPFLTLPDGAFSSSCYRGRANSGIGPGRHRILHRGKWIRRIPASRCAFTPSGIPVALRGAMRICLSRWGRRAVLVGRPVSVRRIS